MDKAILLDQITKLDFMALDLTLYLDTHPTCEKGIALYNRIAPELKKIRALYEETYGPLRSCGGGNPSKRNWMWIDEPFPWDKDFC